MGAAGSFPRSARAYRIMPRSRSFHRCPRGTSERRSFNSDKAAKARYLLGDGSLEQALLLAEQALAEDEGSADTHSLVASILDQRGEWQASLAHLWRAHELMPDGPQVRLNLAWRCYGSAATTRACRSTKPASTRRRGRGSRPWKAARRCGTGFSAPESRSTAAAFCSSPSKASATASCAPATFRCWRTAARASSWPRTRRWLRFVRVFLGHRDRCCRRLPDQPSGAITCSRALAVRRTSSCPAASMTWRLSSFCHSKPQGRKE